MGEFTFQVVLALGCAVVVMGQPRTAHVWYPPPSTYAPPAAISALQLTVSPPHAHVRPGENLTVTCKASAPITRCQLKVGSSSYDLSRGSDSPRQPGVEYHGRGLGAGDCGFTLASSLVLTDEGSTYPLTCRVRDENSDWTYGLMAVLVRDASAIPLSIDKHLFVAQPGRKLNILYKMAGPVTKCLIRIERWKSNRSKDVSKTDECSDSNICSHGNGVDGMECGITIRNVTEEFNGLVWFSFYGPSNTRDEADFVLIIVANPPKTPVLTSEVTVDANGPPTLNAVCTAKGSRPAANITWYLDGEPVRRSELQVIPNDEWDKLSNPKTTTQKLTRRLSDADVGKELWCVAEHFALSEGKRSKKVVIHVPMCPPLTSKSVLISCYLGSEKTDCAQRQHVETVARLSCKPGYQLPHHIIFRTLTCMKTAEWDQEIFSCSPDCGRRKSNSGSVLISGGEDAKVGEFPWHVGIYRQAKGLETPVQICGGSLITTRLVISAAHCQGRIQDLYKGGAT